MKRTLKTVTVTNKSKDVVLASKAQVADTFFSGLKGLLGRDCLAAGEGLIITPCSAIHTCFMRFAIDVIFIDKNFHVVVLRSNLPPFRYFSSHFQGRMVIELPPGVISQTHTELQDTIAIQE